MVNVLDLRKLVKPEKVLRLSAKHERKRSMIEKNWKVFVFGFLFLLAIAIPFPFALILLYIYGEEDEV